VLSIVVPAYSDGHVIREALAALERAADRVDDDVEIIAVLNRQFPELDPGPHTRLLRFVSNLGFASAVMRGVRSSTGEWVIVVNDDCIVEPESLRALLEAADRDRIGSVTGLLVFADRPGIVNAAGLVVDQFGVASERFVGCPVEVAGETTDVFGGTGGFTAYRRAMLEDVGGFDESFFAYYEDADLSWRARMAGWRCIFTPRARAHHAHSASLGHGSAAKLYLVGRNRVRMLAKNLPPEHLRRRAASILLYDLGYMLAAAIRYRTLAPVRGRIAGLREWRRYRMAGAASRREVELAPPPGFRAALSRDRAYRRARPSG
jgi:GT2 family glycosyltransferase